jgi:acetolactate synthase-1/2/3 large subunit
VADPEAVRRAARLLAGARRPLVLLGGGARDAGAAALALARALAAPIGLTINARGTIADDEPLCLGSALSFEPVSELLRRADATVLVGSQFSELELWGLSEPLQLPNLVRIDIDADQLTRRWHPEVALHGDATATLRSLSQALAALAAAEPASLDGKADPDRLDAVASEIANVRAGLRPPAEIARFQPMLEVLRQALGADAIIAGDSTQAVYAANHLLPAARPRSWLMPIGYGCLGCALPMAIGAKLAAPDRPVLALAGDGGFQFTVQELATLRDLRLPVIALVYDNRGYGEIRDAMDHAGVPHVGTDGTTHDLLQIAAGYGVAATRATTLDALAQQLGDAVRGGQPAVIEYAEKPA